MRDGWELAGPAKAPGLFTIVGGLWPLLSMRTFEAVTGPEADRWLVGAHSSPSRG